MVVASVEYFRPHSWQGWRNAISTKLLWPNTLILLLEPQPEVLLPLDSLLGFQPLNCETFILSADAKFSLLFVTAFLE